MKVLFALLGAFAGAAAGTLFLGQQAAAWYTARSEFQSPDEYDETYSLVYLVAIGVATALGYIIGRALGARVEGPPRAPR